MPRPGLRTLLLGVVLTAVAFAVLAGFGSARAMRAVVIRTTLERHELLARQLASEYEEFLTLHLAAVEAVARHAAAAARLDMPTLHPLLAQVNASFPALWGVGVADASGRLVAVDPPTTSDGRSAIGVDLSDRAWFREMLRAGQTVIDHRVVVGRVLFTPTITVNAPIRDREGRFRGAVTGGLALGAVQEIAERVHLGRTGRANVASAEGLLFASADPQAINRDISGLAFWREIAAAPAGRLPRYTDYRGSERLAGFATVPTIGWKVWVSQETAELQDEIHAAYRPLLGWLVAALGLAVALAVGLGLVVTRPLRAVQGTAAAIAAGDLERRAPESGPREVAGLARSFNRMAAALRARIDAEREDRRRLEDALREYGRLAARVAARDFAARVEPQGTGELAQLGHDLNRMAADLERQVAALRVETEALETVQEASRLLAAELDLERLVQALTDAATQLTGAAFGAFFSNVADPSGERYLLYALSGARPEDFAHLPMPRATALFAPTFGGAGPVRLDDVRRDPRYGANPPFHGPPPGHLPVVSYLAVPVVSRSGQVHGGLFFGHPEPGMFTARHERMAVALAAHAAVAMDNARLYQESERQRRAAEALAELGRLVTETLDPEIVGRRIVDSVVALLKAQMAALYRLDGGSQDFLLLAGAGADVEWNTILVRGTGSPSLAIAERRPVASPDVLADPRVRFTPEARARLERSGYRAVLTVPLVVHGTAIGTLTVGDRAGRVFTPEETRLLQQFADQAALALENARLYAEERRARTDAEATSRAKDDFLAMLAHELRNPLAPVLFSLAVIRRKVAGDPEVERALEIAERQVGHEARLLDDLLDVARITRDHIELRREPVDLNDAVAEALEAIRHAAEARRHVVSLALPDERLHVLGDRTRLVQVVDNLLGNAVKYTEPGGRIEVVLGRQADEAVLRVTDTGVGISPDFLPHVFDLFKQADRSLARSSGGLGVGLTMVRRLVELHGGRVSARSDGPGRGSEFVVRLPLLVGPVGRGTDPAAPRAGGVKRIVVIEDNADTRESLRMMLELDGHRVEAAPKGVDGISAAMAHRPDVVLVDVGLPDVDGYEVARRLRQALGRQTRLVALTGYGQPEDRRRAAAAGFDAHLVKPVSPQALARVLTA